MAGPYEELAAALLGEETQRAIAAENPYYKFQAVPESIGQSALTLVAKNPGKFKTKDALAWSVGSGLLSGMLGGAGDSYQQKLSNRYLHAVQGQQPDGDLTPSLFDRATRTRSMFQMQNAIRQREAQDKIDAAVNEKVALTPFDIAGKVAEAEAMLPNYEAKQKLKGKHDPRANNVTVGLGNQLPAATVGGIAESYSLMKEAQHLASELSQSTTNDLGGWAKLRGAELFAGLDDKAVVSSLRNMTDKILRSRTGAAAPLAEQTNIERFVKGDITASPAQISKFLRAYASSEARGIKNKANLASQLASGNLSALNEELDAAQVVPTPQEAAAELARRRAK